MRKNWTMQHDPCQRPRHNKPVRVRFRNGQASHDVLEASKWRWGVDAKVGPSDWDIVRFRVEE